MLDAQVLEAAHDHSRLDILDLGEITAPPATGISVGAKGAFAIRPEAVQVGWRHDAGGYCMSDSRGN